MATAPAKPPIEPPKQGLALRWRLLITLALVIHLTAVIAAPMAVPPSSDIQRDLAVTLNPYIFATYLNHGYRFFAPAPSPGHLVRYTLQMPDGSTQNGAFPDLKTEWPRLFYHRHFMLSEKLASLYDPEEPGAQDSPQDRAAWQTERRVFQTIAKSYADYLMRTYGAKSVTLQLVQHDLPSPDELERDRPLDDPNHYRVLWSGSYGGQLP